MGILGRILSAPVKVVNAPLQAFAKLTDTKDDPIWPDVSRPLEALGEALEKVDEESSPF